MNAAKLYELELSEKFLANMTTLTKTAIRVYLSLVFHKSKRGNNFYTSHKDIRINVFDDNENSWYPTSFGVATCHNAFLKALKQLEELNLIKIHRSRTENGKPLTNRYIVY